MPYHSRAGGNLFWPEVATLTKYNYELNGIIQAYLLPDSKTIMVKK
jgi:hypothetical protein